MADATKTDRAAAQIRLEARKRLLDQGAAMLRIGGSAGVGVLRAGLRTAMPVMEVYAGSEAMARIKETANAEDGQTVGALGLTPRQLAVAQAAGTKALLETIEITSITHPVYAAAPAFRSRSDSGDAQAPHLVHLLSLVAFGREYFGFDRDEVPEPEAQPWIASDQTVLYMATAPGEYAAVTGPQTPTMIRRAAMRQRSYARPELAILSNNTQPVAQPIAQAAPQSMMAQPMIVQPMMMRSASVQAAPRNMAAGARVVPFSQARMVGASPSKTVAGGCGCGASGSGGCGCGGSGSGGCGCGGHAASAPSPARIKADGTCASPFDISCDTRWRLRECFKMALCDMLRCMADEVCEDGRIAPDPDLGACVEGFVCTLLHCLPDAICPPPAATGSCCLPQADTDCTCNFAVGD